MFHDWSSIPMLPINVRGWIVIVHSQLESPHNWLMITNHPLRDLYLFYSALVPRVDYAYFWHALSNWKCYGLFAWTDDLTVIYSFPCHCSLSDALVHCIQPVNHKYISARVTVFWLICLVTYMVLPKNLRSLRAIVLEGFNCFGCLMMPRLAEKVGSLV